MRKNIAFAMTVWSFVVTLSFLWNWFHAKEEQKELSFQTARAFFNQIILTREWNALHGGLYAPVTAKNPPNPYLSPFLRDIEVSNDLLLTKINPAAMTRQISEIASEKDGIHFKITSLKPLSPRNRASEWEILALQSFERGVPEKGEFFMDRQEPSFQYMAPLVMEEACMECHANQNYKLGDIRGGIRITLPFIATIPIVPLLLGHLIVGIMGGLFILIMGIKLGNAYNVIREQATVDTLTGVANRRYFAERLLEESKRCKREKFPMSLIICDIDNFKKYNDTYGHMEGDRCLKLVAEAIKKAVRRPADLCARYGGEEFVVILPNTDREGAFNRAEEMRSAVEELQIAHLGPWEQECITISLGIASDSSGMVAHENLIREADKALYQAKKRGRNCIEISPEVF